MSDPERWAKYEAMTLFEIIRNLESLDDNLTICAARSPEWTEDSNAILTQSYIAAADCPIPYFLEVSVAKDVIRAWSHARSGRVPTSHECCEALIYYATNDAYLLPAND